MGLMLFQTVFADHKMLTLDKGQQIPQPEWFKDSFLDLADDLAEAQSSQHRLVLYFHQAGCPYCYNLVTQVFTDPQVNQLMQQHFDLIAFDLWGDKTVTLPDGSELTEKQLAVKLKVQYTPTLIFLDNHGTPQLRMNGYHPPTNFLSQITTLLEPSATKSILAEGLEVIDLRQDSATAIEFISADCSHCQQFGAQILNRPDTRELLSQYRHVRLNLTDNPVVILPGGERINAAAWAARLGISYMPAWLLTDERGQQRLTIDSFVRAFHFNSALEYVATKAYLRQPEFQRFINERGDRLRSQGYKVQILQ